MPNTTPEPHPMRAQLLEEIWSRGPKPFHPPTSFFSTTDRTLTCLLRLPPEIRALIYRHLLYCGRVNLRLLPSESLLVLPRHRWYTAPDGTMREHLRHGLSTSILACSRKVYEEGCEVLYGENYFSVVRHEESVMRSWPIAQRNVQRIGKILPGRFRNVFENVDGLTITFIGNTFPRLRYLSLDMRMTSAQWARFLERSAPVLRNVHQGAVVLHVVHEDERAAWDTRTKRDEEGGVYFEGTMEDACVGLYKPAVEKYLGDKTVEWTFMEDADDAGWYMAVYLYWGRVRRPPY